MLRKLLRAMGARHASRSGEMPQSPPKPPAGGGISQRLDKLPGGMIGEVEREARDACARDPHRAESHYVAGKEFLAHGDFSAAATELRCAIELDSGQAEFFHDLGIAFRGLGEKRQALAAFERTLAIGHGHVSAAYHAGLTHAELGELADAKDCYSLALAFDPCSSAARIELAGLLMDQDMPQAALDLLREALAEGIADAAVYSRLARFSVQTGDVRAAEDAYRAAIERFPDNAGLLVNFGMLWLGQLGDATEAETLFRRAIAIDPESVEAQANLGLSLQEQGRFDEALRHYEGQLALRPAVVEYRWNRGLLHLIQGNFREGWRDYELRKSRADAGGIHDKFNLPDWDGSPLRGRSILIYGEQGLGDEIMFASCLPEVISDSGSCTIECDARLESLYRRSFPEAKIAARASGRGRDWRTACPELEIQSAIGSLPRFLRRSASDFPPRGRYLVADGQARARWRARFETCGGAPTVGISWRGGTPRTRGLLRSIALGEIVKLIDSAHATFVVLQRGLTAEEHSALAAHPNVWMSEEVSDLDELAALVSVLDLTISVPSTTVHLAGALGRPLWVLLGHSPEWRYLWEGERMPWYPSAKLYRRNRDEDWQAVLARVALDFNGFFRRSGSNSSSA